MAEMTVAEIDTELGLFRTYRSKRLRGESRVRVTYEGTTTETALPSLEEIRMEIARLEAMRAGLTGIPSGNGPMNFGFGGRV